jgi:hypothetical protein
MVQQYINDNIPLLIDDIEMNFSIYIDAVQTILNLRAPSGHQEGLLSILGSLQFVFQFAPKKANHLESR